MVEKETQKKNRRDSWKNFNKENNLVINSIRYLSWRDCFRPNSPKIIITVVLLIITFILSQSIFGIFLLPLLFLSDFFSYYFNSSYIGAIVFFIITTVFIYLFFSIVELIIYFMKNEGSSK